MTHATLRVLQKQANVRTVRLHPETVVGRSLDCTLKIASTQVSRRHCRILERDDGVFVEDLGSANGTFLDGSRLTPNVPTLARPGSQLAIGPATFVVEYQGVSPELGAIPLAPQPTPNVPEGNAGAGNAPENPPEPEAVVASEPPETGEFPVAAFEESYPEFDFAVAEPTVSEAPPEEPAPKRMRSLFGLFGRSKKSADPPAAVPFLPAAGTHAPSVAESSEAAEATLDSTELAEAQTLMTRLPVADETDAEAPHAEANGFDFVESAAPEESAGDDDLQNFLQNL